MKVLITGANGQLGKALNKNKLELDIYKDLEIFNSLKSDLDLRDELSCIKTMSKSTINPNLFVVFFTKFYISPL